MSEGSAKAPQKDPGKGAAKPRKFQAIKGTRDILPPETALWNRVEQTAHAVFATYGFGEIRVPIFEPTELFARSIGQDTDIVSKEMYTFQDRERTEIPGIDRLRDLLGFLRRILTTKFGSEPRDGSAILTPGDRGKVGREFVPVPLTLKLETDIRQELETVQDLQFFVANLDRAYSSEVIPQTRQNHATCVDIKRYYKKFTEFLRDSSESISLSSLVQTLELLLQSLASLQLGYSLTLRPEATAAVCRAYIEHGMHTLPQPVKHYYLGPMFRREQPQAGRYRQFYQIGAEVLGGPDAPAVDAELIEMLMVYFRKLGLEGARLDINSIGCQNCRPKYVELLREALRKVKDKLGLDSQRRIETNPLRVFDSKLQTEQAVIAKLPHITDHLCADCAQNYADVKRELALRDIAFQQNWRLVRGLDYYMRTTFEIIAQGLGAQNAVCGGGRYDGLVELLGGPPTKGIGFAIGEDRLILSLQESGKSKKERGLDVFIAWMGEPAYQTAVRAARTLRDAGFSVELPGAPQKFGKALGQADKLGARYALILGEDEIASGQWTMKTLADGRQSKLSETDFLKLLKQEQSMSS